MNLAVSKLQGSINAHKRAALSLEKQIRSFLVEVVLGLRQRWDEFSAGDVRVNGHSLGAIKDTDTLGVLKKNGPVLGFEFSLAIGDFTVVSGASMTVGSEGTVTLQIVGAKTVVLNQSQLDQRYPGDDDPASIADQITVVIQNAFVKPNPGQFLAMVRLKDLVDG